LSEKLPNKFFIIYFSKIFVGIGIGIFLMFILLSLWHSYNSAFMAAIPFIIMSAVPSLLSPILGTQIDRHSKYKLGLISLLLSLIFLLPLYFTSNISWIVLIFTALISFETYFNIDYTISVRNIVGDENLMYTNNLWIASIGVIYVIAYILGAYFYSYLSFTVALLMVTLSYSLALVLWLLARVPEVKRENKNVKYSEIFKVLKEKPALFHLILIYDFVFLFVVITRTPAYIPYCFNLLKMSSFMYGVYSAFSAFLIAIVPLSLHKFINPKMAKKYAVSSILYEGILTVFIALIPIVLSLYIYRISSFITLIILSTFASTLEMDGFMTIFQKAVPTNILGRFYAVRSLFRGPINIASLLIAGYLTDILGPVTVIITSGILSLTLFYPTKRVLTKINL